MDLQQKIDEARRTGHSDDDITQFLSRDSEVGGKIQEALQAGHNSTDILKFVTKRKPTVGEEPLSPLGLVKTMGGQVADAVEGIGAGAISTGTGLYNLARKGVKATGLGELPEAPEFIKKAGSSSQFDAEGNPVPASTAFGVGRIGEQAGEFIAPGGLVAKGAKAASRFGKVAEVGARVLGDVGTSTAVTGVQTGGDASAMAHSAIVSGIASGALSTVGGILTSIPNTTVYLKNLKFPERFRGERVEEIIGKAIDDGILISKGGINKAEFYENLSRKARETEVAKHANALIDINVVRAPVMKLRQMAEQLGETGIVKQIDKRLSEFEMANGARPATKAKVITVPGSKPQASLTPAGMPQQVTVPGTPGKPAQITMQAAQQAKDDFNLLAQNMFGKFSPGPGQIRKLIGAGIKDAMENISPEIKELNRDTQNYKLLKNAISQYVNGNRDLLDPRTAVLAWWSTPAAVIYGALSNPYVRSALAIAKERASKSGTIPAIQSIPRLAGAIPSAISSPEAPQ